MITKSMSVEIKTLEKAPIYREENGYPPGCILKIKKAIIVEKGTKEGNPTVDLQCEDGNGKKFLIMATGGVLEMLAGSIKGTRMRTNG